MKIVKYLREIHLSRSNKSSGAIYLDLLKFQIVKQLMDSKRFLMCCLNK